MEALGAALASLALSDSVIYAQTAREYGVDPTTLQRRHQGKQEREYVKRLDTANISFFALANIRDYLASHFERVDASACTTLQ